VRPQDEQHDGGNLRGHLDLPQRRRRQRLPARMDDAAQDGDGKLAAEDDRHHPGRRESHLNQRQQRRGDEQLVGERIHPLADAGHLAAAPGEKAIEPVGERGHAENGRTEDLVADPEDGSAGELREEHDDQQRHQEDAPERDAVRQIHDPRHCTSKQGQT